MLAVSQWRLERRDGEDEDCLDMVVEIGGRKKGWWYREEQVLWFDRVNTCDQEIVV